MTEKKPRPRGQVEPLGAGKFRVRVPLQEQGPNGRARTHSEMLYNSTPQKAAKRRDKLMAQIDAGLFFSPAPLTVKALSEEWMAQQKRKSLAITTVFNYQDTLNFYVLPHVGHLQLKDLQPKALERMFNALQDRALADATIRHARAICKLIIRYAIWKKYLKENPLEGLELPKGAEARDTKSLTPEEARTLVETALLDLDDLIFVFALFTGMRPKEYLGLPLSNVELLEEGYALVRVTQQAVRLRRGGDYVFPKPKTAKGIREIPIPAWLYREVMRLKSANEARAPPAPITRTSGWPSLPGRASRLAKTGCAICSPGFSSGPGCPATTLHAPCVAPTTLCFMWAACRANRDAI